MTTLKKLDCKKNLILEQVADVKRDFVLTNLFTVLKKLKECVGFFFFNNLIATNVISLGEVADFGKINFQLKNKYDAKRKR